jgi:hypothetical protein
MRFPPGPRAPLVAAFADSKQKGMIQICLTIAELKKVRLVGKLKSRGNARKPRRVAVRSAS